MHQTWTVRINTAGIYTLPADWRVPHTRWQVQAGTLDTGGHSLGWRDLTQDGGTLLLGASSLSLGGALVVTGGTFGASAASVDLAPGVAPVPVTLPAAAAVHALRVRHGDLGEPDVILGSGGTVGTLTLEPGAIVQTSGASAWTVGSLGCMGNAAAYIQILGAGATFTMGSAPACDYVALENVVCAGATPCVAGPQAIDLGGNTNWQFPGGPLPTWTPTPTRTPTATASPTPTAPAGCAYVTLNTARLATGEPEEWSTVAVGVGTAPEFQQCVRDLEYQTLGTATVLEPGMEPISVALNLLLRFDTAGLGVEWPGRVVTGAWLRLNVTGGWADDGRKSLTADWYDWGTTCVASDHSDAALSGARSRARPPGTAATPTPGGRRGCEEIPAAISTGRLALPGGRRCLVFGGASR